MNACVIVDNLRDALQSIRSPGPSRASNGERRAPAAPKGWEPGVPEFYDDGRTPKTIVTPAVELAEDEAAWSRVVADMGIPIPPGYRLRLVGATYDPASWTRETEFYENHEGHQYKMPATTKPMWRYRFAVELLPASSADDTDLQALYADLTKRRRKPKTPLETPPTRAICIIWADLQIGKVDRRGGTKELLERVGLKLDALDDWIDGLRITENDAAYLLDAGDIVEGFENTPQQARTNDLQQTEQVRVARRATTGALVRLAPRFSRLTYATCGSNHCRVRRGKDALADPLDDWGIEIGSQIQDGFALNPDAFGHVSFLFPEPWRESLAVEVVPGREVGLVHGHQVNSPDSMASWWEKQSVGPVGSADVLVHGHFHHTRMQEVWEGRWLLGAPTLDSGSAWHENAAGRGSAARLMAFVVDEKGLDTRSLVLL